jgi:hypothetical protein
MNAYSILVGKPEVRPRIIIARKILKWILDK